MLNALQRKPEANMDSMEVEYGIDPVLLLVLDYAKQGNVELQSLLASTDTFCKTMVDNKMDRMDVVNRIVRNSGCMVREEREMLRNHLLNLTRLPYRHYLAIKTNRLIKE